MPPTVITDPSLQYFAWNGTAFPIHPNNYVRYKRADGTYIGLDGTEYWFGFPSIEMSWDVLVQSEWDTFFTWWQDAFNTPTQAGSLRWFSKDHGQWLEDTFKIRTPDAMKYQADVYQVVTILFEYGGLAATSNYQGGGGYGVGGYGTRGYGQ